MTPDMFRKVAAQIADGLDLDDEAAVAMSTLADDAEKAERHEAMRQARIFAQCFETDAGRACLALLRDKLIRPPTQDELEDRDPAGFALAQARLQGMGQVYWMIEAALEQARRGEESDAT